MKPEQIYTFELGNYYGEVVIFYDKETEKYYMGLGGHSGFRKIEITKDLHRQMANEIGQYKKLEECYAF